MAESRSAGQARPTAGKPEEESKATKDEQESQEGVPSEAVEPEPADIVFGNATPAGQPGEDQTAFMPAKDS